MRISDWSSDVCSSDLNCGGSSPWRTIGRRTPESRYWRHKTNHIGAYRRWAGRPSGRCIRKGDDRYAAIYYRDPELAGYARHVEPWGLEIGSASCRERVCPYVLD